MREENLDRTSPGSYGGSTGQQHEVRRAQRIDVRPVIDRIVAALLGTHKQRRADELIARVTDRFSLLCGLAKPKSLTLTALPSVQSRLLGLISR